MKRQLVAEEWDKFARKVLPPTCSPTQKQEMRRAFYAGAQSILFGIIAVFAPATEPTSADLQVMDDLHNELNDFAKSVKEGRA